MGFSRVLQGSVTSSTVDAAGAVMESDYDANTILAANTDDTPVAITIAEGEIIGRASGGNITGLSATQVRTIINVENGATADQTAQEIATAIDADATAESTLVSALDIATLTTLASSLNGQGASLVSIEDSGGLFTATDVEAALAENRAAIDVLEAAGYVVGPSSVTDNTLVRFNSTTGKLIQESGIVIDDSDNITGVTSLVIDSTAGLDVTPGSDINADLITVNVTGTPTLSWNESSDAFISSKPWVISSDGNGDITHTVGGASVVSDLEIHSEGATDLGGISIHRHTDSNDLGGHLLFLRSDGSHATPSIVDDDDTLGRIMGIGYDGTDYELAAEIRFEIDGTPSNDNMPGAIAFYTNAGSQTLTKRGSFAADGTFNVVNNITVGGTVDGRDVASDGSKLDTIESNATADQTAQEIATAIDADATAESTLISALDIATLTNLASTSNGDGASLIGIEDSGGLYTATDVEAALAEVQTSVLALRAVLSAARTYYVRKDGSDSNTGLVNSSGGAFLTVQKALDTASLQDFYIYDITVKLVNSSSPSVDTWSEDLSFGPCITSGGILIIEGDTSTPTQTVISGTTFALSIYNTTVQTQYVTFTSSSVGVGLRGNGGQYVIGTNTTFGAHTNYAIYLGNSGNTVYSRAAFTISGSMLMFITSIGVNSVDISALTLTLSGTPNFSVAFIYCRGPTGFDFISITKSGSATGAYANLNGNGWLFTNGVGESALPGNAAGTYATGSTKDV